MQLTKQTEVAREAIADAGRQARETALEARKQARRRLVRARISAARAQERTKARTSGPGAKAVGAAGAVGLAAGYLLDRTRRRTEQRDGEVGPATEGQAEQAIST
jgi:hypothetical protein